jgi:sporulation related protein
MWRISFGPLEHLRRFGLMFLSEACSPGGQMVEPRDPGHPEDAMLKLMVEFRQIWLAGEALRAGPSAPPPPTPTKRIRLRALIPLLLAAITSAYLIAQLLEPSSRMSLHVPWGPRGQAAAHPAAGGTPPPASLLPAADRKAGGSTPPLSAVSQDGPPPAAGVDSAALGISAPRPEQSPGYHVQAGAFNVREYAEDLMHQLRSHDYPATLVDARTGPPHRVWIKGTFDRSGAEQLANRLRRDGFEAILLPQ